jgi:hypothetical protein
MQQQIPTMDHCKALNTQAFSWSIFSWLNHADEWPENTRNMQSTLTTLPHTNNSLEFFFHRANHVAVKIIFQ